ncbi:MAG: hypothetical protein M1812_000653 [Candelaria pacifica]|nr:MAG: hypothetical protein M1812_000653 [Candelaria pacifica]
MLSSLLRPKQEARRRVEPSPFSSPFTRGRSEHARDARRSAAKYDAATDTENEDENDHGRLDEELGGEDDEDGRQDATPLLPIFSKSLDSLPVYSLTHLLRDLIVSRCETTLSWDQLRAPQVSQFVVKPIQQKIHHSHLSSATIYALMANCLQFTKEIQLNPGNSGISRTRALICELLCMKLLKEFSTRELIDLLSYDFNPLSGSNSITPKAVNETSKSQVIQPRAARVSTLEIAIRAQAKRFLAHPLVVQQLEAIWAGNIVFHSSADSLHRPPPETGRRQHRGYGAIGKRLPTRAEAAPSTMRPSDRRGYFETPSSFRRSVTLYDPRDASLFKLSRLRVPRLDELVGFNEQGFLYLASVWNIFDLGILLLLIIYYALRLYGVLMPDAGKHRVASMSYDVLASSAVLLFPRLFSVLDHYRYFSTLLIAFRMMAMDLVAVLGLIGIACSGFFVAFTLSFNEDASHVAYALFQIFLGFTPAAWERWDSYNLVGQTVLTLFLFICHFLVVTILITVLTNSFMAVVQNANEEHQFLFAVNTISGVKSDALFAFIAPTNIIAWLLTPLRYIIPFRSFVKVNRTVIKVTHFPVLFMIYLYERVFLRSAAFEPTELIEDRGRSSALVATPGAPTGPQLFSPAVRLREPSVATHQDRALAEVFRPFKESIRRDSQRGRNRRSTSNVVNNWMQDMGPNGVASPPVEQDRAVVDRLETSRLTLRGNQLLGKRLRGQKRNSSVATRSVVSDPEDFFSQGPRRELHSLIEDPDTQDTSFDTLPEPTEGDGDDELVTNEEEDPGTSAQDRSDTEEDFFQTPTNARARTPQFPASSPVADARFSSSKEQLGDIRSDPPAIPPTARMHQRNLSSSSILFRPPHGTNDSSSPPSERRTPVKAVLRTGSGARTPASAGRRTPRRAAAGITQPRPIAGRSQFQSAPNLAGMLTFDASHLRHRPSSIDMNLTFDLGANPNIMGGVPSSFATQMMMATGGGRNGRNGDGTDDSGMMSRLMLSRMNALEEGFRNVLNEVKDWRKEDRLSQAGHESRSSVGKGKRTSARVGKKTPKSNNPNKEKTDWHDEPGEQEGPRGASV